MGINTNELNGNKINEHTLPPLENKVKDPQQIHYELFDAIRKGDQEAFRIYYTGFLDSIVRFLTRLTGNEEDAKEIAQDVFALLWEKREMIEPDKALDNLLYRTAKGMAGKALRRRIIHSKYNKEQMFTTDGLNLSADEDLIMKETSGMIDEILASMPEHQRRVYVAHHIERKPLREVANEMGITYESARTYMKRASAIIKEKRNEFLTLFLTFLLMQ